MIGPTVRALAVLGREAAAVATDARANGIALQVDELRRIAERLGRDPTLVEAHAFDAQWSEHCSYKSSRAFLSRLPVDGPSVVLGPGEDAGIVHLGTWEGERYGIVVAHESHNHPSQVVPFEGAATGVGGIVRDVLCMGARVIGIADPLRFGPLDDPHCRYVAQGVVDGIAAYGNAIGVPNVGGDVYVHDGFRDNCLVNVIALGVVNERFVIHSHAPKEADGWDIVLVGKATDRSGFGGAAFSSLVLDENDAEANKSAVQVPDPFLKSVLMRASYRVFDVLASERLVVGFKDLGAGGIMGCTAELVASGGFGATVDLDRCPTSQPDLAPAVIAVGETQERLAWVVPPHFTPRLLAIYNDEFGLPEVALGACAALIGRVQAQPDYVLRWQGVEVMRVPIEFLTGGVRYERPYVAPAPPLRAAPVQGAGRETLAPGAVRRIIGHRDVCSRRSIFERYDSVVRGATSIPAGVADAGVLLPVPGAPLAVALAVAGNARYAVLDSGRAAELAVCEAVRSIAAVGAIPAALTDCLNFGNPEVPEQFGEFVAAVDGLARAARGVGVPFVSGNVSLYNTSASGASVPGSAIVSCVGTMQDVSKSVTPSLKRAGSRLRRIGRAQNALGGSVAAGVLGLTDCTLPGVDYDLARRELALLAAAVDRGILLAARDVSDGGAFVALAEMCFPTLHAHPLGVSIAAPPRGAEIGAVAWAFGESGGVIVESSDEEELERLAVEHAVPLEVVGVTTEDAALHYRGASYALSELYDAWSEPLRGFYEVAS